jgi:hypothetical protein
MEKRKMHGQISRKLYRKVVGTAETHRCIKQRNIKGETVSQVLCIKDAGVVIKYKKLTEE